LLGSAIKVACPGHFLGVTCHIRASKICWCLCVSILERHMLKHLLAAPWIRTNDKRSANDNRFIEALRELMAHAYEDIASVTKKGESSSKPERPGGILWDMTNLLQKYRSEIVRQSRQATEGGKNVSRSSTWFSSS
jgi:hypothetical protein